ncbi:hypothetical protein MMC11_006849 [Xylographa trunciseda]|nr:hypothetical protein [Xylographa trunciseda]
MSPPPPTLPTPTSRWRALTTRHPSTHSLFVYSVLTTGIYCRPTCPSRLARRANVLFHNTAADAAAAGFRPCKRCKPEVEGWEAGGEAVARAKQMMREGTRGLGELSRGVGLSRSHFLRVFKGVVGCTPREWGEGEGGVGAAEREGEGLQTRFEDAGYSERAVPGAEISAADAWLLDVPTTIYPANEDGSFGMHSGVEDWDVYFNRLALPLRGEIALEDEWLAFPDAGAPTEHMPDIAVPAALCSPVGQDMFDDKDTWWQPLAIEWDVGGGATPLDENAPLDGFESLEYSRECEQRPYGSVGSEPL